MALMTDLVAAVVAAVIAVVIAVEDFVVVVVHSEELVGVVECALLMAVVYMAEVDEMNIAGH